MPRRDCTGRDLNGDPKICMVVGCKKKAIYRHAGSAETCHTQRGYCSAHRHFAVSKVAETSTDYAITRWLK